MNAELSKAKNLLTSSDYTCVICKGNLVYTSSQKGVKPLISWLDEGVDLKDGVAADKVVGKGAAFLHLLLGIKSVYAKVISVHAKEVFDNNNIEVAYDYLVKGIINSEGNGPCPIESAVMDISEPNKALSAIKAKLSEMRAGKV